MKQGHVYHGRLLSFGGIVPGASHYQVKIECPARNLEISVEWKIDTSTAELWTRQDRAYVWATGSRGTRFNSKEDALKAMRGAFGAVANPSSDILIQNLAASASYPGFDRVLEAPKKVLAVIKKKAGGINWADPVDREIDDWWWGFIRPYQSVDPDASDTREMTVVLDETLTYPEEVIHE